VREMKDRVKNRKARHGRRLPSRAPEPPALDVAVRRVPVKPSGNSLRHGLPNHARRTRGDSRRTR
jgi:hypothetical protein